MRCPFCGDEMRSGVLSGDGRTNVCWKEGDKKTGFLDSMMGTGKLTVVRHTLASFVMEADFCEHCKKMIIETDIQR